MINQNWSNLSNFFEIQCEYETQWLIKNSCRCPSAHKDYNERWKINLVYHVQGRSLTQLRGSSPRGLIGDDPTVNMSRSSPPVNCFPPIEFSFLSRCNPTKSFRKIVRDTLRLTWKTKKSVLLKVSLSIGTVRKLCF